MYPGKYATEHPDQAAIIMAGTGLTITYGEYESRANQMAQMFRAAGLRRGDHIAIFMENNPQMLLVEAGAERSGLYFTCIKQCSYRCTAANARNANSWNGNRAYMCHRNRQCCIKRITISRVMDNNSITRRNNTDRNRHYRNS